MRLHNYLIYAFTALATATCWSANANRFPVQQIDRNLVLPRHTWQASLIQSTQFNTEGSSRVVDDNIPEGFFPTLPTYSLTDNLMWLGIPLPYFRYLCTHNNVSSDTSKPAAGLRLALDFGLTAVAFSSVGHSVVSTFGLSAKKTFNRSLWWEANAHAYVDNLDFYSAVLSPSLGYQIGQKSFATSTYTLTQIFDNRYKLGHTFKLGVGTNFTSNISIGLNGSLEFYEDTMTLRSNSYLSFQW